MRRISSSLCLDAGQAPWLPLVIVVGIVHLWSSRRALCSRLSSSMRPWSGRRRGSSQGPGLSIEVEEGTRQAASWVEGASRYC